MKTPTDFLIRLLRLLDGFGRSDAPIDPIARDILLHISARVGAGDRIHLSDIRFNAQFGSPATALGRLQRLIDTGWVVSTPDPDDGRAQVLKLSEKADLEIRRLSASIRKLASRECP